MQKYVSEMKVVHIDRPYPGAAGIQLKVEHSQGVVFAVYRDYPAPIEVIARIPFDFAQKGLFCFLLEDWWIYTLDGKQFVYPDRAVLAAYEVAKREIELLGVQTPIDLSSPLTLETAQRILEAYPFEESSNESRK